MVYGYRAFPWAQIAMAQNPSSAPFSRRQFLKAVLGVTSGAILAGCTGSTQAPAEGTSSTPTGPPNLPSPAPDLVQKPIAQVVDMPRAPTPYLWKDWRDTALKFD